MDFGVGSCSGSFSIMAVGCAVSVVDGTKFNSVRLSNKSSGLYGSF
jgi:hypothetical protein